MKKENVKIEQRLENMKKFYVQASELIEQLPDTIPEKAKTLLKDKILGDKNLKMLMEGIDSHRPPRIFLMGRTGVGKSSLINALCGTYVAGVSDIKSCTERAKIYQCSENGRTLMEILDTRGIAESESLNDTISAEEMLAQEMGEFSPDVGIFMLSCGHRDDIDSDVEFLKNLCEKYEAENKMQLPIVVVVNKCDEMPPARFKNPKEYPENKIDKINKSVQEYKSIIIKGGLKIDNIIAVSSLIDWQTPDGMEVDVETINNLPQYDIDNIEIAFDGRYKIEELLDTLENAIPDFEAKMGLRMAARLDEVAKRLANHLNTIFSGISATIALTPLPVSDIYILLTIQCTLVCLIASLSGREISIDTAKEFIFSVGGVVGAGYALRLVAQQTAKLLNTVFIGSGSAVSSAIAYAGTSAIGKAAIAYYIENKTMGEAKKKFISAKKENESMH